MRLQAVGAGAGAKLKCGVLFDREDEAVLDPDGGLAKDAQGMDMVGGSAWARMRRSGPPPA